MITGNKKTIDDNWRGCPVTSKCQRKYWYASCWVYIICHWNMAEKVNVGLMATCIFVKYFPGSHDPFPLLFLVTQTPETADNVLFKCSEHSSARHQPRCSFFPTWRSMSTLKTEAWLPNKWDHPWSTWLQHETMCSQVVWAKCDDDTVDQFKTRFLILCCIFMILNTFPFFHLVCGTLKPALGRHKKVH